MITLHADQLQEPMIVYINAIAGDRLYCGNEKYPWILLLLTPQLQADITQIMGHTRTMLWKHRKLELYSDGQAIRAKKAGESND
jgi:hypothetical protein